MEKYIVICAVFFGMMNIGSAIVWFILWRTRVRAAYLFLFIACFLKSIWGFSAPFMDIYWVKTISCIVVLPFGAMVNLLGVIKFIDIKAKLIKEDGLERTS